MKPPEVTDFNKARSFLHGIQLVNPQAEDLHYVQLSIAYAMLDICSELTGVGESLDSIANAIRDLDNTMRTR